MHPSGIHKENGAKKALFSTVEESEACAANLKMGNKPMEDPSSFRPICLLDCEDQLYEQLLLERLSEELMKRGVLFNSQ